MRAEHHVKETIFGWFLVAHGLSTPYQASALVKILIAQSFVPLLLDGVLSSQSVLDRTHEGALRLPYSPFFAWKVLLNGVFLAQGLHRLLRLYLQPSLPCHDFLRQVRQSLLYESLSLFLTLRFCRAVYKLLLSWASAEFGRGCLLGWKGLWGHRHGETSSWGCVCLRVP